MPKQKWEFCEKSKILNSYQKFKTHDIHGEKQTNLAWDLFFRKSLQIFNNFDDLPLCARHLRTFTGWTYQCFKPSFAIYLSSLFFVISTENNECFSAHHAFVHIYVYTVWQLPLNNLCCWGSYATSSTNNGLPTIIEEAHLTFILSFYKLSKFQVSKSEEEKRNIWKKGRDYRA